MSDRATPFFDSEGALPQRLKPFFAIIQWNALAIAAQGAAAGLGAAFTSLHQAQQWMAWAIIFDLVSGFFCGVFKRGGLRAKTMGRGIALKLFSFAVIAYLCRQPGLMISVGTASMHFGVAGALWYCVYEWTSVLENMDELGAPVPQFLRTLLARARDIVDHIGDPPKGEK